MQANRLSDHGSHGGSGNSPFSEHREDQRSGSGQGMMLVTAPHSWEVMLKIVFRGCEQTLKEKLSKQTKEENIITVLRYSIPNLRISGSRYVPDWRKMVLQP